MKKRNQYPDRVTLDTPALARLDVWIKQLKLKSEGIEISRKDLLNWIVLNRGEVLSSSEQRQLTETFYDEEKFLRYAWEEIKTAKSKGEKLSLEDILNRKREGQSISKPRKVRAKVENPEHQPSSKVSLRSNEAKTASPSLDQKGKGIL